jgi:hypothetical protein
VHADDGAGRDLQVEVGALVDDEVAKGGIEIEHTRMIGVAPGGLSRPADTV